MKKRAQVTDPPAPISITDQIKGMAVNSTLLFADSPPHSVRALVSRIKGETAGLNYTTRAEGRGTRVWRLA